jgi:ribosomal protein S18 acetylase RimI-like enzyme
MKRATLKDKPIVKRILLASFKNDPNTTWYLEESNNQFKLDILIDYVIDETFNKGEIYLSDDNNATALWDFEKKEKLSINYIYRNLSFLWKVGLKSVIRILKTEGLVHKYFEKYNQYCHLYLIGVMPEAQGQGIASMLMNPIIDSLKQKSIPILLETASLKNIEIYKKKGFNVYETLTHGGHNLYLMSIE